MMTTEKALQTAASILTFWSDNMKTPTPNRLDLFLDKADLVTAVQTLYQAGWGYLAAITGLDLGDGELEVLYHFCAGAAVVTLRVKVAEETAVIPSIYPIIPSVSFFERELSEMFGITVVGTPNPDHLFLPDIWPEGVYPLRKTFQSLAE